VGEAEVKKKEGKRKALKKRGPGELNYDYARRDKTQLDASSLEGARKKRGGEADKKASRQENHLQRTDPPRLHRNLRYWVSICF